MHLTRRSFSLGAAAALAAGSLSARAASSSGKLLDAIVIGAGMSGLNTALLLEQEGQRVLVLEARQRVGGRVLTLFDQPGYPEMGFNSMGAGYGRGLDAARRAGVEMVDFGPRYRGAPPQALFLDGRPLTREQWAAAPGNPFPDSMKSVMPWEVVGKLVSQNNPLADWSEWAEPKNAAFDIPLHNFLRARGLSDAAIRLAFDTSPYYGTSSYDVSALMLEYNDGWIKSLMAVGPGSFSVKGGNQKLPMAMATLLKGDLILGKDVAGISSEADGATVHCRDGSSYRAKRVISSLPFSVLRRVKIEPGLSGPQAKAVATLPYQPLSMVFLTVKTPFWDADKTSPAMWTDDLLGTILPQRFGGTDEEVTGLVAQARGELAHYWDRLGKEGAMRLIVERMEALRPASKGLVTATAYHSWSGETFNAGDFSYFAPGQISEFVNVMATPSGRLHFCGEHTATSSRGLEGALESSERVALEVLSA